MTAHGVILVMEYTNKSCTIQWVYLDAAGPVSVQCIILWLCKQNHKSIQRIIKSQWYKGYNKFIFDDEKW